MRQYFLCFLFFFSCCQRMISTVHCLPLRIIIGMCAKQKKESPRRMSVFYAGNVYATVKGSFLSFLFQNDESFSSFDCAFQNKSAHFLFSFSCINFRGERTVHDEFFHNNYSSFLFSRSVSTRVSRCSILIL